MRIRHCLKNWMTQRIYLKVDENMFEDVRGESETLAGLILELTGEIPPKDQVIQYERFIFRIEAADRRRIKQVRVEIKKSENENKNE